MSKDKRIRSILVAVCLFMLVTATKLVLDLQAVDLTDPGLHLINQRLLLAHSDYIHLSPLVFVSDLVGAVWLALGPPQSLLWARLGAAILFGASATVTYCLLRLLPGSRFSFFFDLLR